MTRKILMWFAAAFLAANAGAQSLSFLGVNAPGIYCHFDPNCQVSPAEQSDFFTPTNVAAACVLASRSFPGNTLDTKGEYGYEYQITLNNAGATGTNMVTVNSLTLEFGGPEYFSFGEHASNQVWVVTSGGPAGSGPDSADLSDKKVTFHFDPPLTLQTATDQSTNTYYFGMVSRGAPAVTTAIVSGSAQDDTNAPVLFKAQLQAQTPAGN
jgi:hypothetical protein